MAVANADLSAMQRQVEELRRVADSKSAALEQARQQMVATQQAQLQALRKEMRTQMDARDSAVQTTYQQMLEHTESALETRLQRELQAAQQQYTQVCAALKTAYAVEQQKQEALLLSQKQFEAAYYARQKTAQTRAESVQREVTAALQQAANTTPIAWFLPGHLEQYRARVREMDSLMELTLYESTIGVGENLLLSLQLDLLEVEERFRRWLHDHTILQEVLETEKELLFTGARQIPKECALVSRAEKLVDERLTDAQLAYWSDDTYASLCKAHADGCRLTERLRQDGILHTDANAVRAYMIAHPEQSQDVQEMTLYSAAMQAVERLTAAQRQLASMHDRIAAYNERLALALQVRRALVAQSYERVSLPMFAQPAEPLVLRFCDAMQLHAVEVILVPVLRRSDDRWVNLAMCFYGEDCSADAVETLQHALADVLVTQQIGVQSARMKVRQTTEERIRLASADVRLQVNGRLN